MPIVLILSACTNSLPGDTISSPSSTPSSSAAVFPSAEPGDPASFGYSVVPNLIGLTGDQVSDELDKADFRSIRFEKNYAQMSAIAVEQFPPPGTRWSKTSEVYVRLDPSTGTSSPQAVPALPSSNPQLAIPARPKYTYRVTGPKRASITYSSTDGNTSQETAARLPWEKTVESPGLSGMTFAYVSAQNSGSGTISCQIIGPSGDVLTQNSSTGPYAIVTCQA